MKKIEISYKLHGSLLLTVDDNFEATGDNVQELLLLQSDNTLVSGIENYEVGEIDNDAIELIEYNEMIPGEDFHV